MEQSSSGLKITPQAFIDKLYNVGEERLKLDDTPPRSFVSLASIETRHNPVYIQSSTNSFVPSPVSYLGHLLLYPPSISRNTFNAERLMSASILNAEQDIFGTTSISENKEAVEWSRNVPPKSSLTTIDPQPYQSALIAHNFDDRSQTRVIQPNQEAPFAALTQFFDHPSSSSPEPQEPDRCRTAYHIFSTDLDTATDLAWMDHTLDPRLRDGYQAQQNMLQNSADRGVPVANIRHDRESLYGVRIRADGSTSLHKLPFTDNIWQAMEPSSTETDQMNAILPQEEETEEEDDETEEEFRDRLTHVLKQMMFVSGETTEPSPETSWMIEEIVRDQVIEMLKEATGLANRRGSKSISIVDLIFQIRHNPAKVSRLRTFLSWKDVRKNVKDSDDKAGGGDADALDLDEGAMPGANPSAPQKTSTNKKAKLILPWEIQSYYSETVPEREDEEDEEEEEQNEATLARLASADERTKNMTRLEYVYWSECRQASFTFRKGKRFREWAGFGTVIDSKPNDDVVDILGFLTFEIVQTLTEEALKVKVAEDLASKKASGLRTDNESAKKRKREGCTLFEMPDEDRTPVEPKHVREAFRRLQLVPNRYKFMRQGYAGVRTPLRMI